MKPALLLAVLIVFSAVGGRACELASPTPVTTPADVPMPTAQSSPSATPVPVPTDAPMPTLTPTPTASPTATPQPAESDEETLARLEQDWGEAIARHDADFLERTESDDYTYTGPDGVVSHKSDEIAGARSGFAQVESFKHRDIKTHVYGDTAVVTGATTLKGTAGDTDLSGEFRWTDVFVRRDGRWQVVASQATAISKPESAD